MRVWHQRFFSLPAALRHGSIGDMKWTGERRDTAFDDWITLQRKNNLCPSACRGDKCASADP